ncbi:hypothetical protein ACNHUS_03630 [Actinomycetes bacterium M1A6_2h]
MLDAINRPSGRSVADCPPPEIQPSSLDRIADGMNGMIDPIDTAIIFGPMRENVCGGSTTVAVATRPGSRMARLIADQPPMETPSR